MRVSAYVIVPASVLVVLAALLGSVPLSHARDGSTAGSRAAPADEAVGGPVTAPGVSRGFDQPARGFAPADTVLLRRTPREVGLNPAPIDAFLRRLADWTDPARGAGYLFSGATALLAHDGAVVARHASGDAVRYARPGVELPPGERVPARPDTIYDLASLSKLFTALVAMQQVEAGRLRLHVPVARYLPAFTADGKGGITVEQLLTHTSGLPATPRTPLWEVSGGLSARKQTILRARPFARPGTRYRYSDLNLLSLQLVLEKVTGDRLDTLVREGITEPLRMRDTAYNPPAAWRPRIAATAYAPRPGTGMLRGSVHDDNAWAMGGVAGHAGLFSTVDDLAVLAQTLLNGGTYRGRRILGPHSVELLGHNYTARFPGDAHGLGFELDQPWYMGGLSSPQTLGHTGFTGTSLVIDRQSRSFAILLANRVHPKDETPSTNPARRAAGQALARSIPVRAPGGGRSWFDGPTDGEGSGGETGGQGGTLTSGQLMGVAPGRTTRPRDRAGQLDTRGPLHIRYDAFVDTDTSDLFVLERSTDGGHTWQPVPRTARSGYHRRTWQRVRATLPAGPYPQGLRLRWRYAGTALSGGRGVNLSGVLVTEGTRVLFNSDCPDAPLTARGWQPLPRPWPLAAAAGLPYGGAPFGCR
ncbi:serine hydrolase domain-containing protein [Streptomyces spirodelae]|uniref:Serine hydrolase n=1 Tax=Streptomyces spirodelae TaxID=2812904 RepID=A0ABS3WM54_9ACTN|nr:serine hydrolase [Streptomyces spirodelae]MBO8184200.1 serine hydrolase [Streptomyces spirodelae]